MASSFITELWVEYAIGMSAFFLRFYARWRTVGFKKFAWDEFFCGLAVIFFTLDAGLTHTYGTKGSAVGLTPETALLLPEATVEQFTIGSKCLFVAWICYICLTWLLKAVLLALYSRLTLGLRQHNLVKLVAAFCVFSWSACIIFHFAACMPIQKGWQVVPYPGNACVLRKPNHALVGALNIMCDIGILAIPLPILWSVRIPVTRKLVLCILFSSGIFVIVTVILRLIFSLGDIGSLPTAASWALRETFVSVITVTAPGIKPLFNKTNWINSSSKGSNTNLKDSRGRSLFTSTKSQRGETVTTIHAEEIGQKAGHQYFELSPIHQWKKGLDKDGMQHLPADSASQEHIIDSANNEDLAIHVATEYRIEYEGSDGDNNSSDIQKKLRGEEVLSLQTKRSD